jgi:hypothetical protein
MAGQEEKEQVVADLLFWHTSMMIEVMVMITLHFKSYLFVGELAVFAHRDDVVQQVGIPLITTTTRSVENE